MRPGRQRARPAHWSGRILAKNKIHVQKFEQGKMRVRRTSGGRGPARGERG